MAVKKLPGQEPKPEAKKEATGYQDKPKVQDYYKQNGTKDGESFAVEKVKKTDSGWLVVETQEWVGFVHGKSELAKHIMEVIAPMAHNKQGNQLVAIAAKKTKNKFVLGLEDEVKMWYYFDSERQLLELSIEKEESFLVPEGLLKLEDFGFTE
jgi:hypothetical protein